MGLNMGLLGCENPVPLYIVLHGTKNIGLKYSEIILCSKRNWHSVQSYKIISYHKNIAIHQRDYIMRIVG